MSFTERRRDPRAQLPYAVEYRAARRDHVTMWYAGMLVNLGAGGLRFTCDRPIGEGETVELRLTVPFREQPFVFTGTVIWANPLTAGADCGVAFADLSFDQQFDIDELVRFLNANALRPSSKPYDA